MTALAAEMMRLFRKKAIKCTESEQITERKLEKVMPKGLSGKRKSGCRLRLVSAM